MTDLDLLRRITRDLWYWQGLRWAPMGLVGFASAAAFSPGWPAGVPEEGILVAAIILGFALYAIASRYYDRTMGHVSPDLSLSEGRSAVKWFAVYPAMGVALVLEAASRSSSPGWASCTSPQASSTTWR